jgi:hypothetical protein
MFVMVFACSATKTHAKRSDFHLRPLSPLWEKSGVFFLLTSNPELKKSVDDLIYGAYGVDNPHTLDWYLDENRG